MGITVRSSKVKLSLIDPLPRRLFRTGFVRGRGWKSIQRALSKVTNCRKIPLVFGVDAQLKSTPPYFCLCSPMF